MDARFVIALLFVVSLLLLIYLEPERGTVSTAREGKVYRFCGVLIPLKELRNGCIYRFLDDTGEIKSVAFFGDCIQGYTCFYGRIESYRGEKEVVVLSYS